MTTPARNTAPHTPPKALIVDDERDIRELLVLTLGRMGLECDTASSLHDARALLRHHQYALCLTDMRLSDGSGIELVKEITQLHAQTPVAMITAFGNQEAAVDALKAGAFDFVSKPVDLAVLRGLVQHALKLGPQPRAGGEAGHKPGGGTSGSVAARLLGQSAAMASLRATLAKVARSQAPVYIAGESGVGKELVARTIHDEGARANGPFVPVNCGAIPEQLVESELFGHKRGAFTGAYEDRVGLFQQADGGTIFLDEIGETSPAFQVKLLRVLQEGEVRPVGASRPVAVDVRVIAATHRDLEQDVRSGRFREDLYYRIASMTLTVPPLRERSADVLPIADMLLGQACQELARPALGFSPEVRASLLAYPWPGNIRELRNEVFRAVALSEGPQVSAAALSCRVLHGQQGASAAAQPGLQIPGSGSLQERLDAIEAAILREALLRHRWNKTHAAKELGLSRMGLRQKLARFGLEGQADG